MAEVEDEVVQYKLSELFSLVPEFNGDQVQLNGFIEACDTVIGLAEPHQVPLLLVHFKNKLKAKASQIINSRSLAGWADIKNLLVSHFGDTRDTTGLLHDLQTLTQGRQEPAGSYVHRISAHNSKIRTSISLNETLTDEQKAVQKDLCESIALKTLLSGLEPKLGMVIRAQKPASLVDAGNLIIEEQRLNYLENTRFSHGNVRHSFSTINNPPSNSRNSFSKTYQTNSRNGFQNFQNQSRPFNFQNQPRTTNFQNQIRSFNTDHQQRQFIPNSQQKFCRYCKQKGHEIDTCYKRQLRNNNSQPSTSHTAPSASRSQNQNFQRPSVIQQNSNFSRPSVIQRNNAVNHLNSNEEQATGCSVPKVPTPETTQLDQFTSHF